VQALPPPPPPRAILLVPKENMFYHHFNALDLRARGVASIQAYERKYWAALQNIPPLPISPRVISILQTWGIPVTMIPYTLYTHDDPSIEGDMAHTFWRSIVLPRHLLDHRATLHHEYVHVLQRAFPLLFDAFYDRHWHMRPTTLPWSIARRRRTNPDALIPYTLGDTIITRLYRPDPVSLFDSDTVAIDDRIRVMEAEEHPHERLAEVVGNFSWLR